MPGMALFKIQGQKLSPVKDVKFESYFEKEKKLQNFTEANLQELFGLEFISTEFNLESFWLDSLAFDPSLNAFVIIEYKKVENFSLMDQGQTYLNLVLDHKADVILEYITKTKKTINKNDIDWSQTRVMFIGPKFNTYQKRALSESLPFELWEITLYDGNLIEYDEIIPVGTQKKNEKKVTTTLSGSAAHEIKTYSIEEHLKNASDHIIDLFQKLREQILLLDPEIKEKPVSWYIAYQLKGYNIASVQVYKDKLMVNVTIDHPNDPEKKLEDAPKSWQGWSKVPIRRFTLTSDIEISYLMRIITQAYELRKA